VRSFRSFPGSATASAERRWESLWRGFPASAKECFCSRCPRPRWESGSWVADRRLPQAASDPLLKLGRHSLIVYWVHIEIVYGRWFWRTRGALTLTQGALALAGVLAAMTALAYLIEWRPRRGAALARAAA